MSSLLPTVMTKSSSAMMEKEEKDWNHRYEPVVRMATIGGTKPGDQKGGVLKHRMRPSAMSVTSGKSEKCAKSQRCGDKSERTLKADKSRSILQPLTPHNSKRDVFRARAHKAAVQSSPKHRMHFDFMGGAGDERSHVEFTILMEALLDRYQNCCLMHFNNTRRCQKNFLHNLLVTEVERRLQSTQSKLLSIELVYYDVRKHDNCNTFSPLARAIRRFKNLQQLLKWLRVEYSQLWADGHSHEYFKFKFNLWDVQLRERNAKFDFIQIYLSSIDRNTKRQLCQLLQEGISPEQSRVGRKTAGYAPLTEDLLKYFGGPEPWYTSIVFDVSHSGGKITNTMLQLANAAYNGLKAKQRKAEEKRKSKTVEKVWSNDRYLSAAADTSQSYDTSKLSSNDRSSNDRSSNDRSSNDRSSNDRSTDEIGESWIPEIDAKFDDLFAAWRDYYDSKHHKTVRKWCKDVRDMTVTADKSGVDIRETSDDYKATNVKWHYDKYKAAEIQLRTLIREVDSRPSCEKLKQYLESKSQKLCEDTLRHKVKQLELCKSRISSAIKKEISALRF